MIEIFQRKMERKNVQVTMKDRIHNEDIRRTTSMGDAIDIAERLKWQWDGHVTRMNGTKWTNRITMWDSRIGKRHMGRQRTTGRLEFLYRSRSCTSHPLHYFKEAGLFQ